MKNRPLLDCLITDPAEFYLFFETIYQKDPASVLDAGAFLIRSGMISRQFMNREIPEGCRLDLIAWFSDPDLKIAGSLYDGIIPSNKLEDLTGRTYDLAFFLAPESLFSALGLPETKKAALLGRFLSVSDRLLTSCPDEKTYQSLSSIGRVRRVEGGHAVLTKRP